VAATFVITGADNTLMATSPPAVAGPLIQSHFSSGTSGVLYNVSGKFTLSNNVVISENGPLAVR
jgi:hypothetical protein